jgi:hypothetical protein
MDEEDEPDSEDDQLPGPEEANAELEIEGDFE